MCVFTCSKLILFLSSLLENVCNKIVDEAIVWVCSCNLNYTMG